jgi:hypothetical protein
MSMIFADSPRCSAAAHVGVEAAEQEAAVVLEGAELDRSWQPSLLKHSG